MIKKNDRVIAYCEGGYFRGTAKEDQNDCFVQVVADGILKIVKTFHVKQCRKLIRKQRRTVVLSRDGADIFMDKDKTPDIAEGERVTFIEVRQKK